MPKAGFNATAVSHTTSTLHGRHQVIHIFFQYLAFAYVAYTRTSYMQRSKRITTINSLLNYSLTRRNDIHYNDMGVQVQ